MRYLAILLIAILPLFVTTKPIDIGKYTIEVEEVINRKTIWRIGSSVTAKNKHKYVGVKALFTPKDKKDNRLDVEDFTLRTDEEKYEMTIPKKQDVFYRGANMIKVRKTKERSIIAVVPKNFKEGLLYYKDMKLGKITCDNDKGGDFIVE